MEMTFNPDKAGSAVAALCGIHCVLTPVVLAALPAVHIAEAWEWAFFSTSVMMALWSAYSTYRHDKVMWPAFIMLAGLSILLMPHLLGWPESSHAFTAMIGAPILIAIHVRNMKVHAAHH